MVILEVVLIFSVLVMAAVGFILFRRLGVPRDTSLELQLKQEIQKLKDKEVQSQKELKEKEQSLKESQQENENLQASLLQQIKNYERLNAELEREKERLKDGLSETLGLPREKIKQELYKRLQEELIDEKAKMIWHSETEARNEARARANLIIAQATTRYAGEFTQERLINVVPLPSDDLKGRIIGKDGRNIKAFEMVTGVDVIIDETPSSIVLSSFNLFRRSIATKVLQELILDGRIQPSRIEEIYKRVSAEMEESLLQDGEEIVFSLSLGWMHPDLKKMIGRLKYRASFGQNTLGHSIEVAKLAGVIAGELGGDAKLARRAGILHDIGKALTQDLGGNHVDLGYEICLKYQEDPVVLNAIRSHHGDEEARSIEAASVCTADVLSAGRTGARREALESFLKRATEIEALIARRPEVKQVYVINSGKEVRVIVDSTKTDEERCFVLAKEIVKEIEHGFQYPGEIKVHVIRESRVTEVAR